MDILYLLIPLSAVIVLVILGVFAWALDGGQFEDLENQGERIFDEDFRQAGLIPINAPSSRASNNPP